MGIVLGLIGFTSAGIAAGSIAAAIHSWIGVVSAGSLFAFLQSVGAAGVGIVGNVLVPVAVVGGVAAVASK